MENKRIVRKLYRLIFVVCLFLLFPLSVFAYAAETTHPALTNKTIELFNSRYSDYKITKQEKQLIMQGSVGEDNGVRWIRHLYDLIYE